MSIHYCMWLFVFYLHLYNLAIVHKGGYENMTNVGNLFSWSHLFLMHSKKVSITLVFSRLSSLLFLTGNPGSSSFQNCHCRAEEPLLDYLFISTQVPLTPTQKWKAVMKTKSRMWLTCEGNIPALFLNTLRHFIKTFYKLHFKNIHRL